MSGEWHNRGGAFVLRESSPAELFTPEDMSDEHRMIAELTEDFISGEVEPHDEQLEHQDLTLTRRLLEKAGELGLLAADVPEEYGGTDLDKISTTLITEKLVKGSSFALSFGAHVGIGSLPIVLFGTDQQKQTYLPLLATGKKAAAYCLTEASSGSDALGARTTAVLSEDGTHYKLNGAKQFITNAGFAEVFIVYAKIDGEKFTAFIVESGFSGVSTGPEERKMGIKGSSTRALLLDNVPVPIENVLGEIGRGHVIAFNILNIGRYKLAAGCVGSSKWALKLSLDYASGRKQFGKTINQFPLIQQKLADQAVRTFAAESMVYRTAGAIDSGMQALDKNAADYSRRVVKAVEEYALECSINKVFATECLDFVADEGVQIHGGYGYIQEYKIERIYRDSRINRIFEGTNEINRLLIPGTLLRKAMKGELPLLEATQQLAGDLIAYMPPAPDDEDPFSQDTAMLDAAKRLFLMVGGTAVQTYGLELEAEQETLVALADMMIGIYAAESSLLRAKKAAEREGPAKSELKRLYASVITQEEFAGIEAKAKLAVVHMTEGDNRLSQLSLMKKLTRFQPVDLVAMKREIAGRLTAAGKYIC